MSDEKFFAILKGQEVDVRGRVVGFGDDGRAIVDFYPRDLNAKPVHVPLDRCTPSTNASAAALQAQRDELADAVEALLVELKSIEDYCAHPDRGDPDCENALTMREWFVEDTKARIDAAQGALAKVRR